MQNALDKYRELFRSMIEQDIDTPISNESRQHAAIIIQELIRSATKTVYIQCSRLAPDVYGNPDTLMAIEEALARGVQFKVAVRSKFPETTGLYELLSAKENCNIQLKQNVYGKDFCVVDGKRARIETDAVLGKAVACACDKELGSLLVSKFEERGEAA